MIECSIELEDDEGIECGINEIEIKIKTPRKSKAGKNKRSLPKSRDVEQEISNGFMQQKSHSRKLIPWSYKMNKLIKHSHKTEQETEGKFTSNQQCEALSNNDLNMIHKDIKIGKIDEIMPVDDVNPKKDEASVDVYEVQAEEYNVFKKHGQMKHEHNQLHMIYNFDMPISFPFKKSFKIEKSKVFANEQNCQHIISLGGNDSSVDKHEVSTACSFKTTPAENLNTRDEFKTHNKNTIPNITAPVGKPKDPIASSFKITTAENRKTPTEFKAQNESAKSNIIASVEKSGNSACYNIKATVAENLKTQDDSKAKNEQTKPNIPDPTIIDHMEATTNLCNRMDKLSEQMQQLQLNTKLMQKNLNTTITVLQYFSEKNKSLPEPKVNQKTTRQQTSTDMPCSSNTLKKPSQEEHSLKELHPKNLNPKKLSPKELKPKEISPKELSSKELNSKEISPKEISPNELSPKKLNPKKLSPKELKPKEISPKELSSKELNSKEISPKEISPKELSPKELGPQKFKLKELSPKVLSPKVLSPKEHSSKEISPKEVTSKEISRKKPSPKELCPKELSTKKINPKKFSPKELSPKEISREKHNPKKLGPKELSPKEISPKKLSPKVISPKELSPKEISQKKLSPKELSPKEVSRTQNVTSGIPDKELIEIYVNTKQSCKSLMEEAHTSEYENSKCLNKDLKTYKELACTPIMNLTTIDTPISVENKLRIHRNERQQSHGENQSALIKSITHQNVDSNKRPMNIKATVKKNHIKNIIDTKKKLPRLQKLRVEEGKKSTPNKCKSKNMKMENSLIKTSDVQKSNKPVKSQKIKSLCHLSKKILHRQDNRPSLKMNSETRNFNKTAQIDEIITKEYLISLQNTDFKTKLNQQKTENTDGNQKTTGACANSVTETSVHTRINKNELTEYLNNRESEELESVSNPQYSAHYSSKVQQFICCNAEKICHHCNKLLLPVYDKGLMELIASITKEYKRHDIGIVISATKMNLLQIEIILIMTGQSIGSFYSTVEGMRKAMNEGLTECYHTYLK